MKIDFLLDDLGEINSAWVTDAAPQKKKLRFPVWARYSAMAACLLLAVTVVLLAKPWAHTQSRLQPEYASTSESVSADSEGAAGSASGSAAGSSSAGNASGDAAVSSPATGNNGTVSAMPAQLVPWAELPLYAQYPEVDFNGIRYSLRYTDTKIPADRILSALGTATARGIDSDQQLHTQEAALFSIAGLSSAAVTAVQFEGTNFYYACINPRYQPQTLGQFIDDLNLKENLRISVAYATEANGDYVQYSDLPAAIVWEDLLSNRDAESAVGFIASNTISVQIDYPLLGYQNITLSLNEDNQLFTNLLDTAKYFTIPKEKADAFRTYLKEHCTPTVLSSGNSSSGVASSGSAFPGSGATVPGYAGME